MTQDALAAILDGDGPGACAAMTTAAQQQIAGVAGAISDEIPASSSDGEKCANAIKLLAAYARGANSGPSDSPAVKKMNAAVTAEVERVNNGNVIGEVTVNGDSATVVITGLEDTFRLANLKLVDGQWLIDSID